MDKNKISNNLYFDGVTKEYDILETFDYNLSSAFIVNTHDFWVYFLCDNKNDLINLLEITSEKYKHFAAVEDWMKVIIEKKYQIDWIIDSFEYVYDNETIIHKDNIFSEKLETEDAAYIFNSLGNKKEYTIKYLEDRIKCDVSAGIKIDGESAAWGLTHDDGTIGFLYVQEKYRNKGYAADILRSLILQKEEKGEKTILNVLKGNTKSNNLMKKLKFKYTRDIYWIKIK